MKVLAIFAAALVSLGALPAVADEPDGNHGFPITTMEQAAGAMSGPFAAQSVWIRGLESWTNTAEIVAGTVRAAAEGIDPNSLQPAQPPQDGRGSQRGQLARHTITSLAEGARRAAHDGFGTEIPPTVVACESGGAFTLQGAPGPEFLLQAEYQQCRTAVPGTNGVFEVNGVVQVALQTGRDGTRVTRVRFGAPGQPYVQTLTDVVLNFVFDRLTLDYEIGGLLLSFDPTTSFTAPGDFLYRIDGTFADDFFQPQEFFQPGAPFPAHGTSELRADGVVFSGRFFNNTDAVGNFIFGREGTLDARAYVARGALQDQFGNFFFDDTWKFRAERFRNVDKTDFGVSVRTLSWDGNVSVQYPGDVSPGCISGDYEVNTVKPILVQLVNGATFIQGLLRINHAARAAIAANGAATLRLRGDQLSFATFDDLQIFGGCRFSP